MASRTVDELGWDGCGISSTSLSSSIRLVYDTMICIRKFLTNDRNIIASQKGNYNELVFILMILKYTYEEFVLTNHRAKCKTREQKCNISDPKCNTSESRTSAPTLSKWSTVDAAAGTSDVFGLDFSPASVADPNM